MSVLHRNLLFGAVALACSFAGVGLAGGRPAAPITAAPGTMVRWSAPGTTRCGMLGRTWAALQETCYYPIDLLQKPGVITVARVISGRRETARVAVGPVAYGTETFDLPDIPQANPSAGDLKRDSRDQALLGKVWTRAEGPASFTLPLGAPAKPLPEGKSFGVKRVLNGKPVAQPVLRGQRRVHRPRQRPRHDVLPPIRDQRRRGSGSHQGPRARCGRVDGPVHGPPPDGPHED